MKKIALFLLATLFVIDAHAKESFFCDYKDRFRLSDQTHPLVYISEASSNLEVLLYVFSDNRSFEIRDTKKCESGYAYVTVAYDLYNWCKLGIKDGPFMVHPDIHASCNGMVYKGYRYKGDHDYVIYLD